MRCHYCVNETALAVGNLICQNLKDLFLCVDPYKIKHDLTGIVPCRYKPYGKKCDLCNNFVASQSYVISSATGRKYYKRRDST